MFAEIADILDHCATFDVGGDFDAFLKSTPAGWVVYSFADQAGAPIQLLCVKNLRQSLKRRLGGDETIGLSKRVNYRDLVRQIRWRRVDSAFEADWIYYEAARRVFPQSYRGMVGFRPAWFVHVNPDAEFPRYSKTIDIAGKAGIVLGPLEDKHAAARLIELLEDAFDLCRYYNILTQSPNGRACAYKEMGKCPAPCDGSISLAQYRQMIEWSARVAIDPAEYLREQAQRMKTAAIELRFEIAAKIKSHLDQMAQLGKGAFRHVRALEDFQYLSLQRGPKPGSAKAFLISRGVIEQILDLIDFPAKPGEVMGAILQSAARCDAGAVEAQSVERIGIVAHHLFSAKQTQGVFLARDRISEKAIQKAYTELQRQKISDDPAEEGEGVLKELQAL